MGTVLDPTRRARRSEPSRVALSPAAAAKRLMVRMLPDHTFLSISRTVLSDEEGPRKSWHVAQVDASCQGSVSVPITVPAGVPSRRALMDFLFVLFVYFLR